MHLDLRICRYFDWKTQDKKAKYKKSIFAVLYIQSLHIFLNKTRDAEHISKFIVSVRSLN